MHLARGLVIGLAAIAVWMAPRAAAAERFTILYTDSGFAWRIGTNDHEAQRRQIEQQFAQDVQNARDDYAAAYDAAQSSDDRDAMVDAAGQRLQDDLAVAADRRVAALDAIYPDRWPEIASFPDLLIVGYTGPCHVCTIDYVGGTIINLAILLPFPGYNQPCLFGWRWGERHRYGDIRPARQAFRSRYEASMRQRARTPVDLAFRNANRYVQARRRTDHGQAQRGDIDFLSTHHLPPIRTNPPIRLPRAPQHRPVNIVPRGASNRPHTPSYIPRATGTRPNRPANPPRTTGTLQRGAGSGRPASGGHSKGPARGNDNRGGKGGRGR